MLTDARYGKSFNSRLTVLERKLQEVRKVSDLPCCDMLSMYITKADLRCDRDAPCKGKCKMGSPSRILLTIHLIPN